MGKFRQFLIELYARDMPVICFRTITEVNYDGFFTILVGYYACGAFI